MCHDCAGDWPVLLELIVAAFIAAYVLLVAFGHVLVAIAIYRYLRERRRS